MAVVAAVAVACGSAAVPSPSPTAQPTPVVTADPHLVEPVSADRIFVALGSAKLGITANNASADTGDPGIIKQINAEIASWPLRITQFSSSAMLRKRLAWKPGGTPGSEEAPYNFVGLNILIQYGPIGARAPDKADPAHEANAAQIVAVLDPLLWPLSQRSVSAIPSRTPAPVATASPTPAPSKPAKTPRPTAKPTPKP
jgi:hypothetical protein